MFEESTTALLGWHPGESSMHSILNTSQAVQFGHTMVRDHLPFEHRTSHTSNIAFLAITTLDSEGRPWVSLVASKNGKPGFVESPSELELVVNADVWDGDPVRLNFDNGKGKLIAGVGIEWATRRRNKFAGLVRDVTWDGELMKLDMKVTQALGNCPKYITTRTVESSKTSPRVVYSKTILGPNERLPDDVIDFIHRADTIFIGTTYVADPSQEEMFPSHLGTNHRGGRPGFVRVRGDGLTLVVPDYSGNRLMNSLGNIQVTPLAGITILDFSTGDILYLTGHAQNVFDQAARDIMDRTNLLTLVTTTGCTFVHDAMPVRQVVGTPTIPSPYNPHLRHLVDERPQGRLEIGATLLLVRIQLHSSDLATFSFVPSTNVEVKPGQAAIIDMTSFVGKREYAHMARQAGEERALNDDGIRTWTVSGRSPSGALQLTIREKKGGYVTGRLFMMAKKMEEMMPGLLQDTRPVGLQVSLLGIDGNFTLPSENKKLLWIAGGIGITPFLSMLKEAISELGSASLNFRVLVYSSGFPVDQPIKFGIMPDGIKVPVIVHNSRIAQEDLASEDMDAWGREAYVCGPLEMEELVIKGFQAIKFDPKSIHRENFAY
ncbi:hypothetical protein OPQ81_000771 [Rhizoctonia solani]|nr:hypothetical protein OPQ81_000771 [Rhizoctonia solani]